MASFPQTYVSHDTYVSCPLIRFILTELRALRTGDVFRSTLEILMVLSRIPCKVEDALYMSVELNFIEQLLVLKPGFIFS